MSMHSSIRLILKGLGLLLLACIPYYFFLARQIHQLDPFYAKATYASPNLIIGASRAQKGIAPSILEEKLQLDHKALNLAFTGVDSPYGESYFKLIKRKIEYKHTPGLFILSVHPLSVMDYKFANGRREEDFRFYDLWTVNAKPNYEYILRNTNGVQSLLPQLIFKGKQGREYDVLHDDGWVERTYPEERKPKSIDELGAKGIQAVRSLSRENWLEKTIKYLKDHGQVVLVRMPIHTEVKQQEQKALPSFEDFIQQLADRQSVLLLDYSDEAPDYTFFDNYHHLDAAGAEKFTARLSEDIKRQNK
jgi:hypothetical protein